MKYVKSEGLLIAFDRYKAKKILLLFNKYLLNIRSVPFRLLGGREWQ